MTLLEINSPSLSLRKKTGCFFFNPRLKVRKNKKENNIFCNHFIKFKSFLLKLSTLIVITTKTVLTVTIVKTKLTTLEKETKKSTKPQCQHATQTKKRYYVISNNNIINIILFLKKGFSCTKNNSKGK